MLQTHLPTAFSDYGLLNNFCVPFHIVHGCTSEPCLKPWLVRLVPCDQRQLRRFWIKYLSEFKCSFYSLFNAHLYTQPSCTPLKTSAGQRLCLCIISLHLLRSVDIFICIFVLKNTVMFYICTDIFGQKWPENLISFKRQLRATFLNGILQLRL